MKKLLLPAVLLVAVLGGTTASWAHHAFAAEFDADKPIDVRGVVTRARLVNPHSWLYLDVRNANGTVTNWAVELGTPNALAAKGLTKADLKAGTEVRVRGYGAKNGGPFGYAVTTTLPDGRTFQTGGAQDNPPVRAAAGN
jgi:hypothetical protein